MMISTHTTLFHNILFVWRTPVRVSAIFSFLQRFANFLAEDFYGYPRLLLPLSKH